MNVKAVVKVMNFHALLRVDASRRQSEKYSTMQDELRSMMRIVLGNRNLVLDKSLKLPDPNLPVLRIYLGSDLGFCGSINTSVSGVLAKDGHSEKIVVGKKVRNVKNCSLYLTQEELTHNFAQVEAYLERAVRERPWSGVELVYNHFYNLSSIKQIEQRIFPLEGESAVGQDDQADFYIEGTPAKLLEDMILAYLVYEVRIAMASAFASENITRQNATTESLKKLDEMEEIAVRQERKLKNQKGFQKTIDSFIKQKSLSQTKGHG